MEHHDPDRIRMFRETDITAEDVISACEGMTAISIYKCNCQDWPSLFQAIARSPTVSSLKLEDCCIPAQSYEPVWNISQLQSLEIVGCSFSADRFQVDMSRSKLRTIRIVNTPYNECENVAPLYQLAGSAPELQQLDIPMKNVNTIKLGGRGTDKATLRQYQLVFGCHFAAQSFDIGGDLSPSCLSVAIEALNTLPNLKKLSIKETKLLEPGIWAALSRTLSGITSLSMNKLQLSDSIVELTVPLFPHLKNLYVNRNSIGVQGAQVIATHLPQLIEIEIGDNPLMDDGAIALASGLSRLESLWIVRCQIKSKGCLAIVTKMPCMIELYMEQNEVEAEVGSAIARRLRSLKKLDLDSTQIPANAVEAIARTLPKYELLRLRGCNLPKAGLKLKLDVLLQKSRDIYL